MTRPVKIMAFEWNLPMLIDVLAELSRQHGWQTVYCVSKNTQDLVKQNFPSAIYHDTHEARYGRPAPELAEMPLASIDQPTFVALGYAGMTALKQMDRFEILDGGFPLRDRMAHFYRLVGYWSAVFDRLQPDVLLMPTAPHVGYDFMAYSLARLRGIRTVMFEYVTTEGLLMAIDRFDDGLPPLTAAHKTVMSNPPSGPVVLSDRMESYLRRLRGSYDQAIPQPTRELLERADAIRAAQAEERKQAEAEAKELAEAQVRALAEIETRKIAVEEARLRAIAEAPKPNPILRMLGLASARSEAPRAPASETPVVELAPEPAPPQAPRRPPATDGFQAGRFFAEAELPDDAAWEASRYRRAHIESIRSRYDELSRPPDLTQPYVYVPLHLQPERSTNPIGGVFDDQYVMVGMIAAALPDGWRVYVKEHPSQFAPQFVSERGRWSSLYETLAAIPKVSLVPLRTGSFDLIDNSRAVATITGTSSWEALVRGIPTLVFGEAWYKGCPGSYSIRTADQCRDALKRIAAGERPNADAVRLFLHTAENTAFVGFLSSDDAPMAGIDEATNIQRLTKAIAECYAASTAGR